MRLPANDVKTDVFRQLPQKGAERSEPYGGRNGFRHGYAGVYRRSMSDAFERLGDAKKSPAFRSCFTVSRSGTTNGETTENICVSRPLREREFLGGGFSAIRPEAKSSRSCAEPPSRQGSKSTLPAVSRASSARWAVAASWSR